MPVNLHLLRLFTAVVDNDGIVAAARSLRISQPAVSRAVRELEQQLGLDLFERTSRRVRLTHDGKEIYAHARAVFAAERAVDDAVNELKGLRRGVLTVGASTTIATYVLPSIIAEFARRYPQVELRLNAAHTRSVVELLRSYALDIALAEAPVNDPAIDVIPWRLDEMVMIVGEGHRLARKRAVTPHDLADERFILREPESGTRAIVTQALHDAGIEIARSISVDGTEVIKQVVAEGFGVAVVSRFAISDQVIAHRLVVLNVPCLSVTRPFNRLQMRQRRPSEVARAFLDLLDEMRD